LAEVHQSIYQISQQLRRSAHWCKDLETRLRSWFAPAEIPRGQIVVTKPAGPSQKTTIQARPGKSSARIRQCINLPEKFGSSNNLSGEMRVADPVPESPGSAGGDLIMFMRVLFVSAGVSVVPRPARDWTELD